MVLVENIAGGRSVHAAALPGHPGLRCVPMDDALADLLVRRTLDDADENLRDMTSDLARFSDPARFAQWRRRREVVCLVDASRSLLGVVWIGSKPMPDRDDYLDPELVRNRGPGLTWAIRLYRPARGHGLASAFSRHAFCMLADRGGGLSLWYQTRADNGAARNLALALGFTEVTGETGGTVVGIRLDGRPHDAYAGSNRLLTAESTPRRSRRPR